MTEISERDWMTLGFFWMGVGFLATMPPISHSWVGELARWIFNLSIAAHVIEAFYAMALAQRAGLDANHWFWKTLFLGYFSLRKLTDLPPAPSRPS